MPDLIASHWNTENEKVSIQRVTDGEFTGRYVLVIHDDPPSKAYAPMLLDKGTVEFLSRELMRLEPEGIA